MAQDFHAAFHLNSDSTMINMSDLDGVNLAAAQALERRTAAMQKSIAGLEKDNAEMRARIERMEAALKRLLP
jgi:predicted  nucleic acid-binding Zn-ribbon protein